MTKHRWIRLVALSLTVALAACGDDEADDDDDARPDAASPDAASPDADPAQPDAASPDADPAQPDADPAQPDAARTACTAPALAPADDGSELPVGGIPDIIISEVSPDTDFVEVYNTTDTDINLANLTEQQWCTFGSYAAVSLDAVIVPAKGYATIAFPITPGNGELVLYKDSGYGSPSSVLDYVCWGAASMRKGTAEAAGKWSGACVPGIPTNGSLVRNVASAGDSAADYSTAVTPTPENCSTL